MGNAFSEAGLGTPSRKQETGERSFWPHRTALDKALEQPGCVVCNHLAVCERKSINAFLYESLLDPHVRRRFVDRGGFCREHFAVACHIEKECWPDGGIAMAVLCGDLLHRAMGISGEGALRGGDSASENRQLDVFGTCTSGECCVFCREQRASESSFLAALEELLDFERVAAELTPGRLCLVHTQAACASWRDSDKRAWARQFAHYHAQELLADLQEMVRQSDDYRFREESARAEQNVVLRPMRFLVGGKESL